MTSTLWNCGTIHRRARWERQLDAVSQVQLHVEGIQECLQDRYNEEIMKGHCNGLPIDAKRLDPENAAVWKIVIGKIEGTRDMSVFSNIEDQLTDILTTVTNLLPGSGSFFHPASNETRGSGAEGTGRGLSTGARMQRLGSSTEDECERPAHWVSDGRIHSHWLNSPIKWSCGGIPDTGRGWWTNSSSAIRRSEEGSPPSTKVQEIRPARRERAGADRKRPLGRCQMIERFNISPTSRGPGFGAMRTALSTHRLRQRRRSSIVAFDHGPDRFVRCEALVTHSGVHVCNQCIAETLPILTARESVPCVMLTDGDGVEQLFATDVLATASRPGPRRPHPGRAKHGDRGDDGPDAVATSSNITTHDR